MTGLAYFSLPFGLLGLVLFYLWGRRSVSQTNKTLQNRITDLELILENKEKEYKAASQKSEEFADKLYRSYAQLSNLDSLLREINNQTELDTILGILQQFLDANFGVPNYVLYIYLSEESSLQFYAANFPESIPPPRQRSLKERRIPIQKDTITRYAHAYAWKRKRAFFIEDMENYQTVGVELENKIDVNLKSLLILPLFLRNKFLGTLDLLDFLKPLSLSTQEVEQLKIIGDYVAGSIESSFLLRELELKTRRVEEEKANLEWNRKNLERLNTLLRKLNSLSDLQEILGEVFHYLKARFRTDLGILLLVDTKENKLFPIFPKEEIFHKGVIIASIMKNFSASLVPESGTLFRTYSKQKACYLKEFPWQELPPDSIDRFITENFQLKHIVQIPLVVQNQTIGILCLKGSEIPEEWTREEFREIVSFCDQVAGSIHNANLRKGLAEEKEKPCALSKTFSQVN